MTESNRDGICRMCLSVTAESMHCLLSESEMIKKIQTCFSVHIIVEDYLPDHICKDCKYKIEDFYTYYQKVVAVEKLLNQISNEGQGGLEEFYSNLKSALFKITKENIVQIKEKDSKVNLKPEQEELTEDVDLKLDSENNLTSDLMPSNSENVNDDEQSHSPIDNTDNINNSSDYFEKKKPSISKKKRKSEDCKIISSQKTDNDDIITNVVTETRFKCLSCFEVCNSKTLLLSHYNTKHKPKELVVKAEYETIITPEGVTFKCQVCLKVLQNKRNAARHVRGHAEGRYFSCKICGRTYKTASEIVRHGRAHDGSRIYCSQNCGYSTAYLGALIQHEKRHNEGDHKYKCEECGKGFQVKTWYIQHQNIHKGLKPFVCGICGAAFHMDRYLTTHKSSVHPQTSDLKRYVCPHCSLPCDSRKAFNEHLKEHGIKSSYLCDLCGKTLSNAEQLKFHKRMHLGVKPFSCSTCNKSFAKKFNLQLHIRTHTGEKAHSCPVCGKKYTQRSALLRHNHRHHSDENPTKCTNCNKSFVTASLIATHQKQCIL